MPVLLIILFIAILLVLYFIFFYTLNNVDTVVCFTGGLGCGKTLLGVSMVRKLYRRQCRRIRWHNFKEKFKKKSKRDIWDKPLVFSNIPLRYKLFNGWAYDLNTDYLLLRARLPERCIVFLDEVGSFASQWDFKNPNVQFNFSEFCRLFRHYTKGGFLVCTEQCSENIVTEIRRRMSYVYNLMDFRSYGFPFKICYTVRCRSISISEEIKTVEDGNKEDATKILFRFFSPYKNYDTYCYSDRYKTVPEIEKKRFKGFKRNKLIRVPKLGLKKFTPED